MQGRGKKRVLCLCMTVVMLTCFLGKHHTTEAAGQLYAEEKDGKLVNISPALPCARCVNGYLFSKAELYQTDDGMRFSITIKNIMEERREEASFRITMVDSLGKVLYITSGSVGELKVWSSESVNVYCDGTNIDSKIIIEDCYDITIEFVKEDPLDPDPYITFEKEIICNKHGEILENEDVTLSSEECGENATYQWFCGDKVTAAGDIIEGANEREYTIRDVTQEELEKFYYCRIWKGGKVVNSKWRQLKEFVTISATGEALPKEEIKEEEEKPEEEIFLLRQVSNIKTELSAKGDVCLSWQKTENNIEQIIILRSQKKESGYKVIKRLSGEKTSYRDKGAKAGETYFYKVIADIGESTERAVLAFETMPVEVLVNYLIRPIIMVKKSRSNGQKYVQIALRKYEGKHVEIYMKSAGKYKKVAIKKGMDLTEKITYRFRYEKSGTVLSFKARTYQKIGGKRVYSNYSEAVKIKL